MRDLCGELESLKTSRALIRLDLRGLYARQRQFDFFQKKSDEMEIDALLDRLFIVARALCDMGSN